MRQAGVLAAAGMVALDEILPRLGEDHVRARRLAEGIAELPGMGVDLETVQTNLVYVDLPDQLPGPVLDEHLRPYGVFIGADDPGRVRFALHYEIDDAGIERTLTAMRRIIGVLT